MILLILSFPVGLPHSHIHTCIKTLAHTFELLYWWGLSKTIYSLRLSQNLIVAQLKALHWLRPTSPHFMVLALTPQTYLCTHKPPQWRNCSWHMDLMQVSKNLKSCSLHSAPCWWLVHWPVVLLAQSLPLPTFSKTHRQPGSQRILKNEKNEQERRRKQQKWCTMATCSYWESFIKRQLFPVCVGFKSGLPLCLL